MSHLNVPSSGPIPNARLNPPAVPTRPAGEALPARLDLAQIFNLVELGRIVWFPPAWLVQRHPRPGISYRTVEDLRPATLAVAWPEDSHSPAVAAFVRAAIAVAAATGTTDTDREPGSPPEPTTAALSAAAAT
ncbi:MAG: hypothetical protein ABJA74_01880 [Lapillicoccus sp.]